MLGNRRLRRQARWHRRNPLFASGSPGLGRLGRLPAARGPSAVPAGLRLEEVFPVFPLEAVDDRLHFLGALLGSDQEGVIRVDDHQALDSY